jgi:hypothetical protein
MVWFGLVGFGRSEVDVGRSGEGVEAGLVTATATATAGVVRLRLPTQTRTQNLDSNLETRLALKSDGWLIDFLFEESMWI